MEGNEMSVAFENRTFNRRSALGGGRMACTLVTGFLGSGKTTLLRHILDNRGDLRIAVLVNEFAGSDVDSLLLDSSRINSAFNLSTVALTHGCACCDVKGPFRDALQRIVDSKHNFDCLLIETSGLARPDMFVAQLEEVGIHLDLTITVVDAESLDKVVKIDIVKKQLEHVDLVLLNKCDLATLGQISDAEDILERLTGNAKVVRSQFCKVPLDLVIDCSKIEALSLPEEECNSVLPVLSHEALPKMRFRRNVFGNTSVAVSSLNNTSNHPAVSSDKNNADDSGSGLSHGEFFSSVTFQSEVPLSLAMFQSEVLPRMRNSCRLLRAKGIIWFAEDRGTRFVFQWSGVKRIEAVSGQPWDTVPKSCLVLIGIDSSELEDIFVCLSRSTDPPKIFLDGGLAKEYARQFFQLISKDGRFKEPSLEKEPLVIFGVKGSPLRGIKESQLSGALMRIVNAKGNIFLTATTSAEEYNLQLFFDGVSDPQKAWDEVRLAASAVISKLCKNFCPCRSDLAAHVH
ncbi:P-loop guanosine triphosphatase YjiA-like [Dioscorea cayenensis subsp. rotundata]|uniref:P-loop guanosine triphosphatase YjiA-like n=1 Tax=Dioscorea cayennensis subsp. rotundata TaxID=55577 RepID=A0AB40CUC5_DIOCR|nr:P-loop guanosine triphosphatase YjiA-like [Dioscorea cayenensis subsp. rotundata]